MVHLCGRHIQAHTTVVTVGRFVEILLDLCSVSPLFHIIPQIPIDYSPRRVNSGPTTRDTVRKSYDFALSHVGQDKDSGDIWMDYIQFLKSGEVIQVLFNMRPKCVTRPCSLQFRELADDDDMGRTTKDGCTSQSLSPRRPNSARERRENLV